MERTDAPERDGEVRSDLRARFSEAYDRAVSTAKRRPRVTIAATLLAFGAVTLAGRTLVRVVRGRRKRMEPRPTERAPEVPVTAATAEAVE